MDSTLAVLLIGFFLAVGIFFVLLLIFVLITKIGDKNRKDIFQKISKEYGLTLNYQQYSFLATLVKDKSYPTLSLSGTVRGHIVLITDIFTTSRSGQLGPTKILDEKINGGH
ncbi:MAG: hypothetical protein Q7S01_05105 [bacterium]|nr:hypothetical protein [bacterium]